MTPKHYLTVFVCTALLGAGAIGVMVLATDRGSPKSDRYSYVMERKMASRIAAGSPVVLAGNVHEAMLRWNIAALIPKAPKVAILGSSHSGGIGSDLLDAVSTMNFSIAGTSLAEHIVTSEILRSRQLAPRTWVVFVDPWYFDAAVDFGMWEERAGDFLQAEARLLPGTTDCIHIRRHDDRTASQRKQSITLEPTLHALDGWLIDFTQDAQIPKDSDQSAATIRTDGSILPSDDRRTVTAAEGKALALRQLAHDHDRYRYGDFAVIDDHLWRLFESWIRSLKEQDIDVWLVLPPYHPAVYQPIIGGPQNQLHAIEARIRKFGLDVTVPIVGSFDPEKSGLKESDFFDGDHLQQSGFRALLAPIAKSL